MVTILRSIGAGLQLLEFGLDLLAMLDRLLQVNACLPGPGLQLDQLAVGLDALVLQFAFALHPHAQQGVERGAAPALLDPLLELALAGETPCEHRGMAALATNLNRIPPGRTELPRFADSLAHCVQLHTSIPALALVIAVGLVAVVGMMTFLGGIKLLGASRASIVSAIQPALTPVLGFLVFSQRLGAKQLLGGALVVGAVVVLESRRAPVPAARPGVTRPMVGAPRAEQC